MKPIATPTDRRDGQLDDLCSLPDPLPVCDRRRHPSDSSSAVRPLRVRGPCSAICARVASRRRCCAGLRTSGRQAFHRRVCLASIVVVGAGDAASGNRGNGARDQPTFFPMGLKRTLMLEHCGTCHTLDAIAGAGGTEEGWTDRINRMIRWGSKIPREQVPAVHLIWPASSTRGGSGNVIPGAEICIIATPHHEMHHLNGHLERAECARFGARRCLPANGIVSNSPLDYALCLHLRCFPNGPGQSGTCGRDEIAENFDDRTIP